MDVETKTSREWTKDVDTETPSRLLLFSGLQMIEKSFVQITLELSSGKILLYGTSLKTLVKIQ